MFFTLINIVIIFLTFFSTTIGFLVTLITYQSKNWGNNTIDSDVKNKNSFLISLYHLLSYTITIIFSLFGYLIGNFIRQKYLYLIGFIPLFVGLFRLYVIIKNYFYVKEENSDNEIPLLPNIIISNNDSFTYEIIFSGIIIGTDSICIYITLFSKVKDLNEIFITIGIFYIMFLHYIKYAVIIAKRSPIFSKTIYKYSIYINPIMLICYGLYILSKCDFF